ncbi:MAG: WD40 repeat domain-containing protein [Zavarzinella sp.]|nr:WD40 repeat domain-containing protein [Zavarzinella sp.]
MTLLAMALLAGTSFGQLAPPATKARTDAEGLPLPDGALARLGSSRFRFDGSAYIPLVFSSDGRQVVVGGTRSVSVFDAATGRSLHVFPLPEEHHPRVVLFLAGGKRLAVGSGDWQRSAELTVYNLADGKAVATSKFSGKSQIFVIDVTPDGSRVLVEDRFVKAYLWDLKAQREVWAFEHPEASDTLPFTADGKRLVLARSGQAELRDAETGQVVGTFPNPGPGFGAGYSAALVPDGRIALRADRENAVAVLAAEGKDRVRILSADRRVERLFFSADSRYMAAPTEAGTQVWDLSQADDKGPIARLPPATTAGFSPDGKSLALADSGAVTLWAVGGWKLLPHCADPPSTVFRVRFLPDGKHVLGYTRQGWVTWPAAGGTATRISDESPVHPEAMADVSADGRTAVDIVHEPARNPSDYLFAGKSALRVTDLETGKDRRIPITGSVWSPVRISPDGRHVSASTQTGEFVTWDARTGNVLDRQKKVAGTAVFGATPAADGKGQALSAVGMFADRGGRLVEDGPMYTAVTVTDHTTGREWKMDPIPWSVYSGGARFSRDESRLVVVGRWGRDWKKDAVTVWDVRTGRRLMSWDREGGWLESVSLAPDNRSVLAGDGSGKLALVEIATGGERTSFRHAGSVLSSAFYRDGTKAVASSPDAPVYVWDLLGDPGMWDATKADAIWADLLSPDAKAAFVAIRKLRANPAEAIAFLRDRVRLPAAPADDAVAGLLQRLDGPRFADREKAQKELTDIAELVRPRLEAVRKTASEEAGRRLDQVLKSTEGLTPERLRHIRACEVLEGIGTPDAVRVLRGWAAGPEGARLMQEAKESLARLGK